MRLWQTLPALLPAMLVVACALPTEERATPYDRDELSPALANTTTTSTTTTTTTPAPTTTIPAPPDSSGSTIAPPTTSSPLFSTTSVDLYYTIAVSDEMARLKRPLPVDVSVEQVVNQLEAPLPDVAEFSYRTWVRRGMVTDVVVERGLATVNLDPRIVGEMSETNLRRSIAQLVLTLTSFSTDDSGAIGRVRFDIDGEGFEVFVPAFGGNSDPGQELAFDDFASLRNTAAPTTTTTTTTTTPTLSTEPESTAG